MSLVSFETHFAPFGGLASVLTKIATCLGYHLDDVVSVFTPFHWRLPKTTLLKTVFVGSVRVPFLRDDHLLVNILRHEEQHSIEGRLVTIHWYFLQTADKQFFAGVKHPYDLGRTEAEVNRNLLRDSLFFGAATARALSVVFPAGRVTALLNDWSALTTALAVPPVERWNLRACLHNGYDSPVADADLRQFGIEERRCPGDTILSRALPLVNGPILTVSQQFALDLHQDIFQAAVFTRHLQSIFAKKGLYGIDHGPFVPIQFPVEFLAEILQGNYQRLAAWKAEAKRDAIAALRRIVDSPATPVSGDVARFVTDPDTPWFLMGGRLDNRQKGFDACAKAITTVIENGERRGKWLLLPMEGIEGQAGLLFPRNLAERFPERVLVLPFIWKDGFAVASAAAAFGLVTSYFEPGRLGSEFVANAAPIVCSATGGSLMQVVPWRASATMHQGVQAKCNRWHALSALPSGIVYGPVRDDLAGWQYIDHGGYSVGGEPDVVQHRERCPLFCDMAAELALAMTEALRLYHDHPTLYYEMVANGVVHFRRNFDWMKTGREYLRSLAMQTQTP